MRLIRAVRREFDGQTAFLDEPGYRAFATQYLVDTVRPHGLALDTEVSGQSYGELRGEAVRADEPVGTLVVAFANPDVYPGRALATYLSHLCGPPASFAIRDQGSAAAFTALRLIEAADPAPALLIVVEQPQLPYRSEAAAPARARGAAWRCCGRRTALAARYVSSRGSTPPSCPTWFRGAAQMYPTASGSTLAGSIGGPKAAASTTPASGWSKEGLRAQARATCSRSTARSQNSRTVSAPIIFISFEVKMMSYC